MYPEIFYSNTFTLLAEVEVGKHFYWNIAGFLVHGQFDLVSGRYIVDAKSIMGIFSLDLSKEITLRVEDCDNVDALKEELKSFTA